MSYGPTCNKEESFLKVGRLWTSRCLDGTRAIMKGPPSARSEGEVLLLRAPLVCVGCSRQYRSTALTKLFHALAVVTSASQLHWQTWEDLYLWSCVGGLGNLPLNLLYDACAPNGHLSLRGHCHQPIHAVLDVLEVLEVKHARNAAFVHGQGRGGMGRGTVA